jgi:hypothetical protein
MRNTGVHMLDKNVYIALCVISEIEDQDMKTFSL